MHFDITTLTALAVFLHLGTALASTFLHSRTDQAKIARIDAGVTQAVNTITVVASALQAAQAPPPAAPPPAGPPLTLTPGGTA